MERKVIKQGNDTLTLTLPRVWTSRLGIRAGDSLNIEMKNSVLEILGKGKKAKNEINMHIDFSDPFLLRYFLGSLYRLGFDEVHLSYDDAATFNRIQKLIRDTFVGFIITNQTAKGCTIKSMTTDDEENIPSLLHRNFLVVLSFAHNCYDLLKAKEFEKLESITYLHDNSDQITRLCQRLIIKNSSSGASSDSFNLMVLEDLELLCDCYMDICQGFSAKPAPFKNHGKLMEMLKDINALFEREMHIIFNFNKEKVSALMADTRKYKLKVESFYPGSDKDDLLFLFHLSSLIGSIRNFFPTMNLMYINSLKKS